MTLIGIDLDALDALVQRAADTAVQRALAAVVPPEQEWLDAAAVARLTGYARRSVPGLVRLRGLPCHPIGRKLRFRRKEVERWMKEHGR